MKVDDVPTSNAATTAAWLCIQMTKLTNEFTIPLLGILRITGSRSGYLV
jgi:hypothetical protein